MVSDEQNMYAREILSDDPRRQSDAVLTRAQGLVAIQMFPFTRTIEDSEFNPLLAGTWLYVK